MVKIAPFVELFTNQTAPARIFRIKNMWFLTVTSQTHDNYPEPMTFSGRLVVVNKNAHHILIIFHDLAAGGTERIALKLAQHCNR
jgi:hypothetical protein